MNERLVVLARQLKGPTGLTAVMNIAIVLVSVLTGLVVARVLGPSDRGLLAVAFGAFNVAVMIGEVSLNHSMTYFMARSPQSHSHIYRTIMLRSLALSVLMSAILVVTGILLDVSGSPYGTLIAAYGIIVPLANQVTIPLFAILAFDARLWSLMRAVQSIGYALIVGTLVVMDSISLGTLVVAYATATAVQVAAATWAWRRLRSRLKADGHLGDGVAQEQPTVRDFLDYSWQSAAGGLPRLMQGNALVLLFALWLDPRQVGLWAVAGSLTALVGPPVIAVGQTALPALARESGARNSGEVSRTIRSVVRKGWLIAPVSAAATVVGILIVAPFVLGPEYSGVEPLAIGLCVPAVLVALAGIQHTILRGVGERLRSVVPEWISLFVAVGVSLIAVPTLGLVGGVISASCSGLATYGAYWISLRRYLRALDSTPSV